MGGGEADEEHEREGDRTHRVDPEGELIARRPDPSRPGGSGRFVVLWAITIPGFADSRSADPLCGAGAAISCLLRPGETGAPRKPGGAAVL
jgi:hypothetical protein